MESIPDSITDLDCPACHKRSLYARAKTGDYRCGRCGTIVVKTGMVLHVKPGSQE